MRTQRKERIRSARAAASVAPPLPKPAASSGRLGAALEYLERFEAAQQAKWRQYNQRAALRREESV